MIHESFPFHEAELIQVGSDEILLSDSIRIAERAREAGVDTTLDVWDDMWHVWHFFAGKLPEGNRAMNDIGIFIRKHLCQPGKHTLREINDQRKSSEERIQFVESPSSQRN